MPAMHHAMRQRPLSPPVERLVNKWSTGGYGVALGAEVTQVHFLDEPPQSAALTAYDREHMKLYMRLLDAATDGADWREAVMILIVRAMSMTPISPAPAG